MTQGNIYLDFNATTPVDPRVKALVPQWLEHWGNPSSIHRDGRGPKKLLRESRRLLAARLGCHPLELIFTSGGSESNNLALQGFARASLERSPQRTRILLGAIEHPSVLKQKPELERLGFEVLVIPVQRSGEYDLDFFKSHLDEKLALVSVMWANNEVGVLAPIEEMAALAHGVGAFFHSDFVQALGKLPFQLDQLPVDLASFSSHKVYALKGAGCLYVRKGTPLAPLMHGGAQERGRRAGTENLLAIASMAHMVGLVDSQSLFSQLSELRDFLESEITRHLEGIEFLGRSQSRLPNTTSLVINGVNGETLLMNLDIRGFSVATGAACSSGNPEPSPVLLAMGLRREEAQSSLRISIGMGISKEQIQLFVKSLAEVVSHLRQVHNGDGYAAKVI